MLEWLGMSVGLVQEPDSQRARRAALAADVTYATASALAFTYLADNVQSSCDADVVCLLLPPLLTSSCRSEEASPMWVVRGVEGLSVGRVLHPSFSHV